MQRHIFWLSHVVMDHVSCPVVPRVVTFALAFALSVVSVVADESGPTHQQVQQETEHLHADGHQEEDECVPPLVRYEQLGEDARQGDDDTGRTCGGQQRQEHPHVTVEARLLHWRGNRKSAKYQQEAAPPEPEKPPEGNRCDL